MTRHGIGIPTAETITQRDKKYVILNAVKNLRRWSCLGSQIRAEILRFRLRRAQNDVVLDGACSCYVGMGNGCVAAGDRWSPLRCDLFILMFYRNIVRGVPPMWN